MPALRRIVERTADWAWRHNRHSGEPGGAPKRLAIDGLHLDQAAHRIPLEKLRSLRGQLGLVLDTCGQRRRDGQDELLGLERLGVRDYGRPVSRPQNGACGSLENDAVAQLLCDELGQQLRAAHEAKLLGSIGYVL